jgi:hypothetical protein
MADSGYPRVRREGEVGAGTACVTLASGDVTAVDRQAGAGDVSRFGAGEVRDQGGNLLRRADGAERHQGRYEFDMTSCHIGCNGPGLDVVGGNPRGARSIATPQIRAATAPFVIE